MTEERKNMEDYYEDYEDYEEESEPKGRKRIVVKILSVLLLLGAISILLGIGIAIGILFTRSGFKDDMVRLEILQEQSSVTEEALADAEAKAESAEATETETQKQLEEAQAEVEDLRAINDSLEKRIEGLKDGLTTSETQNSGGAEYINWKFWTDGNQYRITNDERVFSDPNYETELNTSEVILISRVISPDKILNETGDIMTVYTALSTEGFVYCREVPNIEPIQ